MENGLLVRSIPVSFAYSPKESRINRKREEDIIERQSKTLGQCGANLDMRDRLDAVGKRSRKGPRAFPVDIAHSPIDALALTCADMEDGRDA